MILHSIIKVGNILIFESKGGDGDMRKDMVIFIIVSLAPGNSSSMLLMLIDC